jgi:alpha-1,2-mannosyltransferase
MIREQINSFAGWLTPKRVRAHAMTLVVCLWGVCAVDYATPGSFDRAGNIKFQDFLQFPISAWLISQNRASELYNDQVLAQQIRRTIGHDTTVRLQYFYGPQVALPFIPLLHFSFLAQAEIWIGLSLLMYFGCVYVLWMRCAGLRPYGRTVAIAAIAYPPLFHFLVRGQISAVILVGVTAAYFALEARRDVLAGIALGFLIFKPQFLVAIPLILLLARGWLTLAGLGLSATAQLGFTYLYFGRAVMRSYISMLLHSARVPGSTELSLSPLQMHSLYNFWEILIPWRTGVWAVYVVSSVVVVGIAVAVWKSSSALSVRFSALVLAAVLVNPHIYVYDLLALGGPLLLLADWVVTNAMRSLAPAVSSLLYLTFILPLFGPVSRWTHLQLSVPAFAALLVILWRVSMTSHVGSTAELASVESQVV